ncbi:MAG: hypothetical protein KatS3mg053_1463 [Candidatus Roseilinea sp.]|nr:MAG: hypothetical protein KatS3mg053_1463 [Candidatus Roseilinea sp.]
MRTTLTMRASPEDYARLRAEAHRLAEQLARLGAVKVILFGSLARGRVSLFSDVDLLALFDDDRSPRALSRWVYQHIDARESVDLIAYSVRDFEQARQRPFWRQALQHSEVLYDRSAA